MNEQELCKKRLIDLSKQADRKGIVTFSTFLNLNEQNIYHTIQKELFTQVKLFGVDDDVNIYFADNNILFEFDRTKVVSRLVEGEFFRIDNMLNVDYQIKFTINKREFLDCLDRSSLLIKESDKKPIKLTIEDNMLYLKIDSLIGSMNEEIEIHKEGNNIIIGFNPKFLMDAIRAIEDDDITIYMNNTKSPCVIKDEEESYIYLILPMGIGSR